MALKTFTELGGDTWKIRRFVDSAIKEWSAFNPSIGIEPDGSMIGLFRSSNYVYDPNSGKLTIVQGSGVQNRLYFSTLNEDFTPINLTLVDIVGSPFPIVRGVEDAKLYYRDNSWYFTGVIQEPGYMPKPRMATFKLISPTKARMLEIYNITDHPIEKNWMVASSNDHFDFIYDSVSTVKDGLIHNRRAVSPEINGLRGGPNLIELEGGTYLSVGHHTEFIRSGTYFDSSSFSIKRSLHRNYSHRFVLYSKNGTIIKISDKFCFVSSGIEFACGLAIKDGYVYVSYGKKDAQSWVAKIKLKLVLDMLKDA